MCIPSPTWLVEPRVPVHLPDGLHILEVLAEESAEVVTGQGRATEALDVGLEEGLKDGAATHKLLRAVQEQWVISRLGTVGRAGVSTAVANNGTTVANSDENHWVATPTASRLPAGSG